MKIFKMFLHKSYIWEKSCSWDIDKNVWEHIAGVLNQVFLQNKSMKQPHFYYVDTNSQELKVDWKFFGWACSKLGMANVVSGL